MSVFSGIWIPLVTPFQNDTVDHAALRGLVKIYVDAGVSGLVALGTTGEPSSLNAAEQDAVLDTVLDAASGTPVLVGAAGNHSGHLRDAVARLSDRPVAGILTPAPYYVRPSQAGLIDHFTRLADASTKPLVIYDIPYRTGVPIELPTLLSLAAHPRIVAVKDCAGSLDKTLALIMDGRLRVLAGNDMELFTTLCLGGHGAIAASAHLHPERFVAVHRAIAQGHLDEGRRLFHALAPRIRALFSEPNPAPVKAALAAMGLLHNEIRPPLMPASPSFTQAWTSMAP